MVVVWVRGVQEEVLLFMQRFLQYEQQFKREKEK